MLDEGVGGHGAEHDNDDQRAPQSGCSFVEEKQHGCAFHATDKNSKPYRVSPDVKSVRPAGMLGEFRNTRPAEDVHQKYTNCPEPNFFCDFYHDNLRREKSRIGGKTFREK